MDYPKPITTNLYQFQKIGEALNPLMIQNHNLPQIASIQANSSFELEAKLKPYLHDSNTALVCYCGEDLICGGIPSVWECETKISQYFSSKHPWKVS